MVYQHSKNIILSELNLIFKQTFQKRNYSKLSHLYEWFFPYSHVEVLSACFCSFPNVGFMWFHVVSNDFMLRKEWEWITVLEEMMRVLPPPPVGTRWIRCIQNDGKEQSGDIRVDETAFKQHMCGLRSSK